MAKTNWSQRVFQKPGSFDVDMDDEYCGVIGGEIADWTTVGPAWDWRPDEGTDKPAMTCKVLGQLDHGEFHTAREGSSMDGSFSARGRQTDPVDRGTIEPFRGGPGSADPVDRGSEKFGNREGPGSPDPARSGSMQHGGGRGMSGGGDPARRGTDDYGMRSRSGQIDPARRGTRK